MSDVMEHEQYIQRPRPGTIPLSVLLEFICQKVYTDLMRLVDLLRDKTDLEKKIEIATFFSRTRHLFIRLLALVKWSNGASKVDKCEKISNFLEEQSFFLINSANALSRLLRETLVGARLPPFSVLLAIDVFTNRTYTRLPKSIKTCANPVECVSDRTLNEALLDLNRIIQNRLSLTQLPRQFKHINIENGRVRFSVPNEFQVSLTLMSEALDFPWRILDLRFLIRDAVTNDSNLVHPLQANFILSQVQSRLLYRNFDKRPPLIHLYDMLHAFSMSLQLDVLHEQAQRIRAKRTADQLTVEAYRPGQNLVISYWHSLSRSQFHAQLGLNGKLITTAYLLSIYVDPSDPQKPLCISHRPELPDTETHRIGTILQGSNLSFDDLLSRTIVTRAEHILQHLRQEFMVLSPGPVALSDAPLSLSVPLLWPCHPQELLQIHVDPVHGTLVANCPGLLTPETDDLLVGTHWNKSDVMGSTEGYSYSSISAALVALEAAINRPSARRVTAFTSGSQSMASEESKMSDAQSRSLRSLSNSESRWRSKICQSLEHLRLSLALVRLMRIAKQHRPFWQPVKRSLPIVLNPFQSRVAVNSTAWPAQLVRFQRSMHWPIIFVQLFPNNEYYLACEVVPTPLNVAYKYFLLVCSGLPEQMSVSVNTDGLLVANFDGVIATSTLRSAQPSLFLQITHFVPIDGNAIWFNMPSSSISMLQSFAERAREMVSSRKESRVAQLLQRKAKRERKTASEKRFSLEFERPSVPCLVRLLGMLEENILAHNLALELSRSGVVHKGIGYDADGCLSCIEILSIPTTTPSWQPPGVPPLSQYILQAKLRPRFDQLTHRRSWQLDISFKGLEPSLSHQAESRLCFERFNHQTTEWAVSRLEDLPALVRNVLLEWNGLCCMHSLCYHAVTDPDVYLPSGVHPHAYNLKTLSLVYGSKYLVDISYRLGLGFTVSLGFSPTLQHSSFPPDPHTNVDSNPHMVIQNHLENLLNTSNSLNLFTKTLLYTLPFMCAIEPLQDRTLSNSGLKTLVAGNSLRPVRGMVLIALSLYDFILVYRASLCIRFTLTPQLPVNAGLLDSASSTQTRIQLLDGHNHFLDPYTERGTPLVDSPATSVVPLPAYKHLLKALQEAFPPNFEGEPWAGMTVLQLAQLVQRSPAKPVDITGGCVVRRLSPLESYLSTGLLFHACLSSIRNLDVPMVTRKDSELDASADFSFGETVVLGAFEAHWATSCLSSCVSMRSVRTCSGLPYWKLTLRLSTLSSANVAPVERWSQETLSLMEEYFETRVCSPPFQPSAVTAFFRLFTLPPHACRSIVRLFPIDLHPSPHASVLIRIGLVGLGTSKRLLLQTPNRALPNSPPHGFSDAPELIPGLPGILIRPPRITIQLLVSKPHSRTQVSKYPNPPLAQLILVGYDWDTNRVAILTKPPAIMSSGSKPGRSDSIHNLLQILSESEVEANANLLASSHGDSALLNLTVLIIKACSTSHASPVAKIPGQGKQLYGTNA